ITSRPQVSPTKGGRVWRSPKAQIQNIMKVLIIGAGNMGLTYGQSFVDASVVKREDLYFIDHNQAKADAVARLSAHQLLTEPGSLVSEVELIILGVKPQDFLRLAEQLKPFVQSDQIVLSIMAGIKVSVIQEQLGVSRVVRAMPNLPAQVGQGMTVFTTSENVSKLEVFTIQNLLNTTGKTLHTGTEDLIDASTAISGSGPAFVFFFMDAMMQTARKMGFSDSEAQLLVRQTFLGSINLLNRNSLDCEEWIKRVSSRGGTTEAGMQQFADSEMNAKIEAGLEAARMRAVALSKGMG
ncbi:MAG: pyrroline-5-carboxylate reductase, partial [Bacteroidota bacterium]